MDNGNEDPSPTPVIGPIHAQKGIFTDLKHELLIPIAQTTNQEMQKKMLNLILKKTKKFSLRIFKNNTSNYKIGFKPNLLSMSSNRNNYAIVRYRPKHGFALFRSSIKIYEAALNCWDIMHLRNNFFIYSFPNRKLLRKEINTEPHTVFCSVEPAGNAEDYGNILGYMFEGDIIFLRYPKKIHFVESDKKFVFYREKKIPIEDSFDDFRCVKAFGENNDRLLAYTKNMKLILYEIDILGEIQVNKISSLEVRGVDGKQEFGYRLAVSDDNEYCFMSNSAGPSLADLLSSVTVVNIKNDDSLENIMTLDMTHLADKSPQCFNFYGCFEDQMVISMGLGYSSKILTTLIFDKSEGKLYHKPELDNTIGMIKCYRLVKNSAGELCGSMPQAGISPGKIIRFRYTYG